MSEFAALPPCSMHCMLLSKAYLLTLASRPSDFVSHVSEQRARATKEINEMASQDRASKIPSEWDQSTQDVQDTAVEWRRFPRI